MKPRAVRVLPAELGVLLIVLFWLSTAQGQGDIRFYNYFGGNCITHVYVGGNHQIAGNGANDFPAGTQDWAGFTGLTGTGYTAQLWVANGANQPESSLQPVLPTTTFLTIPAGAGILVNAGTIPFPGVPEAAIATITLRVWDNLGGTITTWAQAQSAGVATGESPLFNSQPVSVIPDLAPTLVGLVSFNIYQVPEPPALTLAGLGAAGLWILRRRECLGVAVPLLSALCIIADAETALAQGQVDFYNHILGVVVTHVYGPIPSNPALYQSGQGPNDYPSGTQDWTGFSGLLGTGYTAQLWAADGPNQAESSLQPATPTTTFQTVAIGAGILLYNGSASLPGVRGGDVATISLRVWDNRGGTVTSWSMAQADGVALGESPLFNSPPTGLPALPPELVGLQSFNIYQAPEPSTLALAGLGIAVLRVLRRRKCLRMRGCIEHHGERHQRCLSHVCTRRHCEILVAGGLEPRSL